MKWRRECFPSAIRRLNSRSARGRFGRQGAVVVNLSKSGDSEVSSSGRDVIGARSAPVWPFNAAASATGSAETRPRLLSLDQKLRKRADVDGFLRRSSETCRRNNGCVYNSQRFAGKNERRRPESNRCRRLCSASISGHLSYLQGFSVLPGALSSLQCSE